MPPIHSSPLIERTKSPPPPPLHLSQTVSQHSTVQNQACLGLAWLLNCRYKEGSVWEALKCPTKQEVPFLRDFPSPTPRGPRCFSHQYKTFLTECKELKRTSVFSFPCYKGRQSSGIFLTDSCLPLNGPPLKSMLISPCCEMYPYHSP